MNKRLFRAVIIAVMLLVGHSAAFAAHTGGDVDLYGYDDLGNPITIASAPAGTPYSPKLSCGSATSTCHPAGVETQLGAKAAAGGTHDYGSGEAFSTHLQGVLGNASDSKVYWQAYQNKSFEHGVSVGKHSNQGRNETYTNTHRAKFGDLFFTSSPGMYGKY